jgi:hypothetical protein
MLVFGREEKRRALQFIGAQLNTIVIRTIFPEIMRFEFTLKRSIKKDKLFLKEIYKQ